MVRFLDHMAHGHRLLLSAALALCSIYFITFYSPPVVASPIHAELPRQSFNSQWHLGDHQNQGLLVDNVPNWVTPIAYDLPDKVPSSELADGVYYLLIDEQSKVTADGSLTQFNHYATKAMTPKGLEAVSQISITFDPAYQKIIFHKMNVIRDGVVIDKKADSEFNLQQVESGQRLIYDASKTASWFLHDIRVGDIVDYQYSIVGTNPVYQGIYSDSRRLQWDVPVHQQFLRIIWGKKQPLNFSVNNTEMKFTQTQLGNEIDYQLMLKDMPVSKYYSDAASWFHPYASAYWSEMDSWQQVREWAQALFAPQIDQNQAIQELVNQFRSADTQAEQIMLALNFVQQDIRYLGIEIGANSHLPAKASDTLAKRYGDCKDKSVLLIALLRGLGIQASPVLVNTKEGKILQDSLPRASAFNHMIVKVSLDNKFYWLDPTLLNQNVALPVVFQPNYGFALVVGDNTQQLELMDSAASGSLVEFHEVYDFTQGVHGEGSLHVTTTYQGEQGTRIRGRLADIGLQSLSDNYQNYYKNSFNDLEVATPMSVSQNTQTGTTIFKEHYVIKQPWIKADNGSFGLSVYESQVSPYISMPESHGPRVLSLSHPITLSGDIKLKLLDQKWTFDKEVLNETNPFFDFNYKVTFDDSINELTLAYHYQSKVDRVEANEVDQYVAALRNVADVGSFGLVDYGTANSTTASDNDFIDDLDTDSRILLSYVFCFFIGTSFCLVSWLREKAPADDAQFYPVSTTKMSVMIFMTLGVYIYYWCYKNWQYIRTLEQSSIWPRARAFFNVVWYFPLFAKLKANNDAREQPKKLISETTAISLFVVYVIVSITYSMRDDFYVDVLILIVTFLPLALYINRINDKAGAAYQHNSRWRLRHLVIGLCVLPLYLVSIASTIGLSSQDEVIEGQQLWSRDIAFLRQHQLISEQELPVLFYSHHWLNNQAEGNGFSATKVFSYWTENGKFISYSVAIADIKDITTELNEQKDQLSTIMIEPLQGEAFRLVVSNSKNKDSQFVEQLTALWKTSQNE